MAENNSEGLHKPDEIIKKKSTSTSNTSKFHGKTAHINHLNTVLEILEKSIDYSKKQFELEDLDFKMKEYEVVSKIRNKLKQNLLCFNCKGLSLVSKNQCGHLICLKCLVEMVQDKKNCTQCNTEFSESLVLMIVENATKMGLDKLNIICKICNINEIPLDIQNSCGHVCLPCIKNLYRKFLNECPICFRTLYDDQLLPYSLKKVTCDGCNGLKSYIQENCQKFKCNHMLCGNCIQSSIEMRKCAACENESLNNLEILKFIRAVTEQCSSCKRNVLFGNISRNNCCKKYICKYCENNEHRCKIYNNPYFK